MYRKIIQVGDLYEVYTYEKAPNPPQKRHSVRRVNPLRRTRNVARARATFFRLVRSNLGSGQRPAFLTLTMREVVSVKEGWRAYTLFVQRWKNATKTPKHIVAVLEFQERGAVHFHCLVWGLSDEEIAQERNTRRIAKLWTHGFIDIRISDGSPKLAGYLAKYMSKAMYDNRLSGQKSFSASRSLVRPVSFKTKTQVFHVEREIAGDRILEDGTILEGVDSPLVPQREREYNTQWLGKCVYQLFSRNV